MLRPKFEMPGQFEMPGHVPVSVSARRSVAERMVGNNGTYDELIASFLCAVSAWSYSDPETFIGLISRLGLPESDCVPIRFENDPLLVNSYAYFIQTKDRKLAIVSFRGTKPFDPVTWLGNISAEADPFGSSGRVHGGFNRTVLALLPDMAVLFKSISEGGSIAEAAQASRLRTRLYPEHAPLEAVHRYGLLKSWLQGWQQGSNAPHSGPPPGEELQRNLKELLEREATEIVNGWAQRVGGDPNVFISDVGKQLLGDDPAKVDAGGSMASVIAALSGKKSFMDDIKNKTKEDLEKIVQHELENIVEREVGRAVDTALAPPEPPYTMPKLYITGHSLGGALAVLTAAHLYFDTDPGFFSTLAHDCLKGVYTFGQPMVGDCLFTKRCQDAFGPKLFRHIYGNDLVPRLPPRSAGKFAHTGTEYRSTADGWAQRDRGAVSQTLSILWSLPLAALNYLFDQLPFVNEWAQQIPIPAKIVALLPVHYSVGDHSPLKYLRTSNATRPGTEFV